MNAFFLFLKTLRFCILSVILFSIVYLIITFFGSAISTYPIQEQEEVNIYVLSNGVHTDIVVPTIHETMNWNDYFPPKNTTKKDTSLGLLALGWGSKGFYLETPTWADLTASTALKAAFGLSESAIHATYYKNLTPNNKNCFKIAISNRQYKKLCSYIIKSLKLNNNKSIYISTDANYGKTDAFYEAHGAYNLFYTCNTWANHALKSSEQRAALWTPFDKGILKHYKK